MNQYIQSNRASQRKHSAKGLGKEIWKIWVFRRDQKTVVEGADCGGDVFRQTVPYMRSGDWKARSSTVDSRVRLAIGDEDALGRAGGK